MTTGNINFGQNGQAPGGFGSNFPPNQNPQQNPFQQMDPNLLRILMPDVFGEPDRISSYEDAVFAGQTKDAKGEITVGTFSVMIFPPTVTNPEAEMAVSCNGRIRTSPERLKKIGDAFLRWAKDEELIAAFNEAQEMEPEAQNQSITTKVMKKGI